MLASSSHNQLITATQFNCDLSDALFAQDVTLCIYLLQMRAFYRWQQNLPVSADIPGSRLNGWIQQREGYWEQIEAEDFRQLELEGEYFGPFAGGRLNQRLIPHQLVYSGGYGRNLKPHFFLAELEELRAIDGFTVYIAGHELARDCTAPPAMSQGKSIYIRKESLHSLLWERFEEWQWRKQESRFERAIEYYDFEEDIDAALSAMTENEIQTVILHEIGEGKAGLLFGERWHEMLIDLGHTKASIIARAVRDHIADLTSTLPGLIEQENRAALAFYFANLNGLRAEIFPNLDKTLSDWSSDGRLERLDSLIRESRSYWTEVASHILALHRTHRDAAAAKIERFMEPLAL